ncbi:MAG: hypothetical protein QOG86_1115 [Thermoleophilaceae bacterium]|jgi:hypothetical protein|nr:hypothetical protein [Thermoleophilaceae bacterium]MEA2351798.1 hypothetical protein [Thermoleophilaceae bacterium]
MRHLARVHPAGAQGRANGEELTRFCTHCAFVFDGPTAQAGTPNRGRVCVRCGLGVVLTCSSATLTAPGAAFFVVTADLRVSAASQAADDMFAVPDGSYGRPLLSLLTSPAGVGELARLIVAAANGTLAPATLPVQASASKIDREMEARIGGCGNPPAALVVVDSTGG